MTRIVTAVALCLAAALVALAAPSASASPVVAVGCGTGETDMNQQFVASRAGDDGIVQWTVVQMSPADYQTAFIAYHPFTMYAYRKNRAGKWVYLGISGASRAASKGRHYWKMTSNKRTDDNEEYLFQAKPGAAGQAQTHWFRGVVVAGACKGGSAAGSTSSGAAGPTTTTGTCTDARRYRTSRFGTTFRCTCGPNTRLGAVWGSGVYTDDSSICAAAVHMGLFSARRGGSVSVRMVGARQSYQGGDRYGVSSRSYGRWHNSFTVSR